MKQAFLVSSGFRLGTRLLPWLLMGSRSNFSRLASPGKVHHCSMFSPYCAYSSHCGLLESQTLRNGLITLFRLIDDFVSHMLCCNAWVKLVALFFMLTWGLLIKLYPHCKTMLFTESLLYTVYHVAARSMHHQSYHTHIRIVQMSSA